MTTENSAEIIKTLNEKFLVLGLYRPMRVTCYEPGTELVYDVTSIENANKGRLHLVIEKFIGAGFAGQVYRVKVTGIESENGIIGGVQAGGIYAMKILIPTSGFSRLFRNFLYWVGFQGAFQPQVNPSAARAGGLWQKFIRRAAKIRFGDETAVKDIHVTFIDNTLGSCGELSEWVDGRTWQLEVDDHMDLLKKWSRGAEIVTSALGSPEYRAKKEFMADFVKLLGDIGAYEFARQYEWSTCKSQPNCLKRTDTEGNPSGGLTAVDFRAGLVLLPFLPMSPGDFKLIINGLKRGSLVQFDRGDIDKLENFIQEHKNDFSDMQPMLDELKAAENIYRNSLPDITHNHLRLLYSKQIWSTILDSAVTGCSIQNLIDKEHEHRLRENRLLRLVFFVIGTIPFSGKFLLKACGHSRWQKHYLKMLTDPTYLAKAIRGKITEKTVKWYRTGRVNSTEAIRVSESARLFLFHMPFSILPARLHRFLTDSEYMKQRLIYYTVRPLRLYFNSRLREQWLLDMVTEGQKKHIVSNEDAEVIRSHIKEPFIQKYLKSLAVHICTLPVTQIVSVTVAIAYVLMHPEMPKRQAWTIGAGIIALFQVVPISPGSLVRGFYVLYLVIRERNFKDYNIAVFLGFFKYIGYLAFPIQMAYHYPALARFMASHWATKAVYIVPVFGERGALLEHRVFGLFYNWPLTIRRCMRKRAESRAALKPRYWHTTLCSIVTAAIFTTIHLFYQAIVGVQPGLKDIWPLTAALPLACGAFVTLYAAGTILWKRIAAAAISGALAGFIYTAASAAFSRITALPTIAAICSWRIFILAILAAIGAILVELNLPDPDLS